MKYLKEVIGVLVLAVSIYGTYFITNYIRDHEVYRTTAEKCSTEKSILGQEIEQLNAQINLKEEKVEQLKNLPVR